MGDADLTANAQAAMSLLADPDFELKAGEATNLLTHNFIGVALAAQVVHGPRHCSRARRRRWHSPSRDSAPTSAR